MYFTKRFSRAFPSQFNRYTSSPSFFSFPSLSTLSPVDFLAAIISQYKATYTGPQVITPETGRTCCYKGRNVHVMNET